MVEQYLMHPAGVGHGDIKPNNFLISKSLDGILSCIMIDFGSSVIRGERRFPTRNDLWSPLELDSMSHLVGFDEIKQADLFAYGLLALHLLIPHETLLKFGLWLLRDPEVSVAKWNEQVGLIKQLKTEDPYSDLSLASKASRSVNESNLSALARSVLLEIIEKTLRPLHGERTLPWHRVKSMVERYL
jgi:serine/threonine protein kinase